MFLVDCNPVSTAPADVPFVEALRKVSFSVHHGLYADGTAAALLRLELATPAGDLLASATYNKLFTIHGVIMVWFFLIPSVPTVLGNFLLPLMIGARDVAFPRLNLASWYIFMFDAFFAVFAIVAGGVDTGWTFYTPYSSTYANGAVIAMAAGVFITGFASTATGLNFIVTIHKMRAPGLTWFRLPLFVWTLYTTSLILVLATPVLAITLLLMVLERVFGVGIFDPALDGDPILFQHLFWFYSHPAVYIMILPGMGVVSEIIACFARKRIFGYRFVAYASIAIAVLGFLVWGHHMFVSGQSVYAGAVFSLLSFLVAVPSAIKVFNWTATLYKGSISFDTPMLYALGRRTPHRHLLRHRAFPLRHGWRDGHGLPRRAAFLVAKNQWAPLPRISSQDFGHHDLHRFQPDLFSAIHSRHDGACRAGITSIPMSSSCLMPFRALALPFSP